jgi:DNA (cytosine-5)-methyltransferase 1
MKVLELFAGIGACSKALKRLGIKVDYADVVEIDKYAIKSFNAVHGTNFETQDITQWNKNIEDVDLIMHGSPCQDFSLAGKQAGADEGSGTRSSLMYETIRIVDGLKPKYVVWENVKNVLSKKHKHNFDNYINTMEELNYNNYYQVLNAKDYGIPQNRERVFVVSIRKDIDNGNFEFPEKQELKLKLKDMLEIDVDEKYFLSDKAINGRLTTNYQKYKLEENIINNKEIHPTILARYEGAPSLYINNANKQGYSEAYEGDSVNLSYPESETRRGRVGDQVSQTLTTSDNMGVVVNERN